MSIRFRCHRCRRLLGIASRKAGSRIQCPKCGVSQAVPSEEAAAAALAMDQFAKAQENFDSVSDLVVFEDEPSAIETSRPRVTETAQPSTSQGTSSVAPPVQFSAEPGRPVPPGMILFPRRTVYVQGILFVVIALAAFASGYFIGRGDASRKLQVERKKAQMEKVLVEGKLTYNPGAGQRVGDEGAAIIALPQGKPIDRKIPFEGLRPQDPVHSEPRQSARLIGKLGGGFARADTAGDFHLLAPDKGKYFFLIISKNTNRQAEAQIDEIDLSAMAEYFTDARALIGRCKYRWSEAEVNAGFSPIEHDFGRSGQDE